MYSYSIPNTCFTAHRMPSVCHMFAAYRSCTQRAPTCIDTYIILYYMLGCSNVPTKTYVSIYFYIQLYTYKSLTNVACLCVDYTLHHYYIPLYFHPTYTTHTCFIAYWDTTHSVPMYYILYIYAYLCLHISIYWMYVCMYVYLSISLSLPVYIYIYTYIHT